MNQINLPINASLQEYNRICKEINKIYREAAQKLGLSNSAFDIFYTICEYEDGCQQKDICEATFLPKQTVHSAIHNLEKEGLIVLTPGKGRGVKITLSGLGKEKIIPLMKPVFQGESAAFDAMTLEDSKTLLDLSNQYVSHLRDAFSDL
ncbi:MAG: helix-turn-helix domain-containing protein [Lachnospiraceae bacterium]|nr:MarR family transcriptional regulator [Lachnospiraceae bacterium]MDD6192807.1 helix-turn-helix domain-containing protein [Lachnospiraceae bacterium]MDY4793852.1 helix-turn-helix domain-containing protein [Pararoseburia sp.]